MAATLKDIQRWIKTAHEINQDRKHNEPKITHIISVCDTFDYDDFPVYVLEGEDLELKKANYSGRDMVRINEVIVIK